MLDVYNFLREEMPAKQFRELISGGPAVFVPSTAGVKMKDPVEGAFVGGTEVCWSDSSKTFKKYRPVLPSGSPDEDTLHTPPVKFALKDFYPAVHAKELFLHAGVPEFPSVDDYLRMLIFVSRLSAPTVSPEVQSDMNHVFESLGRIYHLRKEQCLYDDNWDSLCRELRSKMNDLPLFPTKSRRFVSPSESPVLADSEHLQRVFKRVEAIGKRLVNVYGFAEDSGALFLFKEVLGFPSLQSAVLESVKEAANFFRDKEMTKFFNNLLPVLQRFIYTRYPGVYAELSALSVEPEVAPTDAASSENDASSEWLDELSRLRVFRAEKVLVEYRLHNDGRTADGEEDKTPKEDSVIECLERAFWADDACLWIQRESDDRSLNCANGSWLFDVCYVISRRICRSSLSSPSSKSSSHPFDSSSGRALFHFLYQVSPTLISAKTDERSTMISLYDLDELPESEKVWHVGGVVEEDDEEDMKVEEKYAPVSTPAERESGVVLQLGLDPSDVISDLSSQVSSLPSTVAHKSKGKSDGGGCEREEKEGEGSVRSKNSETASISSKATYLDDLSEAGDSSVRSSDAESGSHFSGRGDRNDVGDAEAVDDASLQSAASDADRLIAASAAAAAAASSEASEVESMPPPDRAPPKRKWSSKYADNADRGDSEAALRTAKMRRGDEEEDDGPSSFTTDENDEAARQLYFADSAWKFGGLEQRLDDLDYEHVGDGAALRLPETEALMRKPPEASGGSIQVGRWGEELVYKYFLSRLKLPDSGIMQVTWGNKFGESGMPYDIVLRMQCSSGSSSLIYVEVKATRSHQKHVFEISPNEIQFALDQKENYQLFRVFNAGDPDKVRIAKIKNVSQQLNDNTIKLCMVI